MLAHSFSGSALRSVTLNGKMASEGYFNATLAGAFDKPVIFVFGDQFPIEDRLRPIRLRPRKSSHCRSTTRFSTFLT